MLLCLVALGFSGCATMNEKECLLADWHTIGYEDGVRGVSADVIGKHRKACADHGVAPDRNAYMAGRSEGLKQFCTSQNGFNLGERGGHYNGVCPSDLEPNFLDAYHAGHTLYELRAQLRSTNNQISYHEHELDTLEADLERKGIELVTGNMTSEERANLLLEIKDMAERKGELKEEIKRLRHDRAVHEHELEAYRASLAYNY